MGKNKSQLASQPIIQNEEELSGPHKWISPKTTSVTFCSECGLVWLKNRITQICIKAGCGHTRCKEYLAWKANGRTF